MFIAHNTDCQGFYIKRILTALRYLQRLVLFAHCCMHEVIFNVIKVFTHTLKQMETIISILISCDWNCL